MVIRAKMSANTKWHRRAALTVVNQNEIVFVIFDILTRRFIFFFEPNWSRESSIQVRIRIVSSKCNKICIQSDKTVIGCLNVRYHLMFLHSRPCSYKFCVIKMMLNSECLESNCITEVITNLYNLSIIMKCSNWPLLLIQLRNWSSIIITDLGSMSRKKSILGIPGNDKNGTPFIFQISGLDS